MKINPVLFGFSLLILVFLYLITLDFSSQEMLVLACIFLMIVFGLGCLRDVHYSHCSHSILSDGRFYVASLMTLYCIWVPILALISNIDETPFYALTSKGSTPNTISGLLQTCYTSVLLLAGLRLGFFLCNRVKYSSNLPQPIPLSSIPPKTPYKGWLIVTVFSTLIFLVPFFLGGFDAISEGGNILDVETHTEVFGSNPLAVLVLFLFNGQIMAIAPGAFIMYYLYSTNPSVTKKAIVVILTLLFYAFLAIITTRSGRFVIFLFCVFATIMNHQTLKNSKPFKLLIYIIPLFISFVYFIDYFIRDNMYIGYTSDDQSLVIELMRRFDGLAPYDALFKAVNQTPNLHMIFNPIFSFFRPIPIIGSHITDILGIGGRYSPLYLWMANEYPARYAAGGGLAYMPQIEAYLTAGFVGCFIFGIIYGLVLGKRRVGLSNLIVVAIGLTVARGSLGVLGGIMIPYVLMCYFFYNRFLFGTKV